MQNPFGHWCPFPLHQNKQVQGKSAGDVYLVFPKHFCSCQAFFYKVVHEGEAVCVSGMHFVHVLASVLQIFWKADSACAHLTSRSRHLCLSVCINHWFINFGNLCAVHSFAVQAPAGSAFGLGIRPLPCCHRQRRRNCVHARFWVTW